MHDLASIFTKKCVFRFVDALLAFMPGSEPMISWLQDVTTAAQISVNWPVSRAQILRLYYSSTGFSDRATSQAWQKKLKSRPEPSSPSPGSFRCTSVTAVSIFCNFLRKRWKKFWPKKMNFHRMNKFFWNPKSLPCSCSCWGFNGPRLKALYL